MKRYLILCPLLALAAGCPITQRQDTPVPELRLTAERAESKYWLYVPSYYDAKNSWPMVVTLHGTHGWDSSGAQVKEWKYLAEQKGFIVAAPDLKSVQGILPVNEALWYHDLATDERSILAVIEDTSSKYNVDSARILLTGFSAGGYPLYDTGLRHPELFSMLIARNCNSSIKVFERIDICDSAREMPIVVFWGKGDLQEVHRQSWQAVRWLGEKGFTKLEWKKLAGGHLRRPETAYSYWGRLLPKLFRE